ncbi:hypothetical protein CQ018_10045 [Arthrobacter sp. MYb227]|uniref:SIMPL domain-containing protein n=1 Tax=Arthrobacter sp. MYb227 TaxID=1848601 RepID=UPI000CFA86BF|nr:SIMPL domain-containing protein [Arthrobacter sp. MYb227]PQZ92816.1 hypothetical protein CQ018_10045 [Arthrobacter sp. MYb227]
MSKKKFITMNGSATVSEVPDLMSISLAIEARHDQAQGAYSLVAQRSTDMISALSSHTPLVKLATTGIGLRSRTSWHNEENVVVGYEADTSLQLTGVGIEEVSEVLAVALAAGGDYLRINSVTAEVSDPLPAQYQARELAFNDARAKAKQLAALAGCSLGSTLSVKEIRGAVPGPVLRAKAAVMAESSMPVVAGEQELSVHVEVSWELISATKN